MKIEELYTLESSDIAHEYGLDKYEVPEDIKKSETDFFEKIDKLIPDKRLGAEISNSFYELYYDSVAKREIYAYKRGFKTALQLYSQCIN